MIKHVVFVKFKPEVSKDVRRLILEQLRALPPKIDVIKSYEVGENVLKSDRAWDAVIIGTYDDLDALDIYINHDAHMAVVAQMSTVAGAIASVDFEY